MTIDSNYGYPYSDPYSGSTDPWSNYGLPSSYGTDLYGDSYYQAYEQQLISYIQNLKTQMAYLQAGTPDYETAMQYLNTAMGYLQQIDPQMASDPSLAGWDPLSNPYGTSGYPPSNPLDPYSSTGSETQTPVNSFPISYQDATHIVTDEGEGTSITLSESDTETRTIDVYQMDNTLTIPSNAAQVNVVAQPDDAVAGATMFVITYTCNGHTRTVKYHNVNREDFNLHILAPDKSQITLDASVTSSEFAGKVTAHELGEVEEMQGTPPDETDSESRTWNTNAAVDYYVTEGPETDYISSDSVKVTMENREQVARVTKTGDHEYTIEIYSDETCTELVRTIQVDQVSGDGCLDFINLSAGHLLYTDITGGGAAEFKAWDDPSCQQDPQITVNGQAGGALAGPLDPDHPDDSVPTNISADGTTANYEEDEDVSIHSNPDDEVDTHEIYAGGNLDIYPNTEKDTAEVYYEDGMIVIEITCEDENGQTKTETFRIDASMADKINLHIDPSKINYHGADDPENPFDNNALPSDVAEKIYDGEGKKASIAIEKDELLADETIQQLMADGGYTEDQILNALEASGLDLEDLQNPPLPPSDAVIRFFEELDPKLKALLKNTELLEDNPENYKERLEATERLVKDLQAIYDQDITHLGQEIQNDPLNPFNQIFTYSETAGLITIGGRVYDIFGGSNSGEVEVDTWSFNNDKVYKRIDPVTGDQYVDEDGDAWWIWWENGTWQTDWFDNESEAMEELNDHDPEDTMFTGKDYNPSDPASWY